MKGNEPEWREAVVSDERSFSMDMVKVAATILNKSAIPEDQITGLVLFMTHVTVQYGNTDIGNLTWKQYRGQHIRLKHLFRLETH